MEKLFYIILLTLLIFSHNSKIKKYNLDKTKLSIILSDITACICITLDDYKINNTFYLTEISNDKNSKIDKTLYYNYIESCDSKDTCDDIYINNYIENNDRDYEIDSITGFGYEYKFNFKPEKENQKAILIYYKDFTGKEFTMNYVTMDNKRTIITLYGYFAALWIILNLFLIIYATMKMKRNGLIK